MNNSPSDSIKARIEKIRELTVGQKGPAAYCAAASIAQSVIYDTVGGSHPVMRSLEKALDNDAHYTKAFGAARAVIDLYEQDALKSPRLAIAGEIESDLLETAQSQIQAAETNTDQTSKTIQTAIAAFLAGSALEDALRRLCDANQLQYDIAKTTISKLQTALYQPTKDVEVINRSEYKHITAWGDTRNKADHGKFSELTHTEVVTMIMGVRSFIERHLL